MPKTRSQKQEQVEKLTKRFQQAKGVAFATFSGVKVSQIDEMRKSMRSQDTVIQVAKKNLLRIAAKENNLIIPTESFEGEVAAVFSMQDEIGAAKQAAGASKKLENWKIVGGVLEGRYLSGEQVVALSKLPSKQEMLGQTVRALQGPIAGFVNVLAANLRGLVQALQAVAELKK